MQRHGRYLLGDEMGVGKTVQALTVSYAYKADWPLLVVCPASLKYNWKDECLRWIPQLRASDIHILEKTNETFNKEATIFIMSYDMATRRYADLEYFQFGTVIADEAHYMKSRDAKRSKKLLPVL